MLGYARAMRWALIAVAAVTLTTSPGADAYRASGDGLWKDRVVTYTDRTGGAYGNAARMAVAAYGRSSSTTAPATRPAASP